MKLLIVVIALLLLVGCGSSAFLTQREDLAVCAITQSESNPGGAISIFSVTSDIKRTIIQGCEGHSVTIDGDLVHVDNIPLEVFAKPEV